MLGQVEIGFGLSGIMQTHPVWLGFHIWDSDGTRHYGYQQKGVEWGAISQDPTLVTHQGDVGWVGQPPL